MKHEKLQHKPEVVNACLQSESCASALQFAWFKWRGVYFQGKWSPFLAQFHKCSTSGQQVFVEKSAYLVWNTGVCSNLLVTISRRFHWDINGKYFLSILKIPTGVTDQSIGLCDCCFWNEYQNDCINLQQSPTGQNTHWLDWLLQYDIGPVSHPVWLKPYSLDPMLQHVQNGRQVDIT